MLSPKGTPEKLRGLGQKGGRSPCFFFFFRLLQARCGVDGFFHKHAGDRLEKRHKTTTREGKGNADRGTQLGKRRKTTVRQEREPNPKPPLKNRRKHHQAHPPLGNGAQNPNPKLGTISPRQRPWTSFSLHSILSYRIMLCYAVRCYMIHIKLYDVISCFMTLI